MHGLPVQQLSKSAHGSTKTQGVAENKIAAKSGEGANVESANGDFSSLFASMAETSGKTSEVKSEKGETLKNLLSEKKSETDTEKKGEGKVAVDPKNAADLLAKSALVKTVNTSSPKTEQTTDKNVENKISSTNRSLDQLLNSLKGTQDLEENQELGNEKTNSLQNLETKKGMPVKGEFKSETPLEFLMKGAKDKGITENTVSEENPVAQKKVTVTGEEYLKNMQSAEKKAPALAVLNGKNESDVLPKMINQNARTYGQGLNLISDPLIRNTKDLASKDTKKQLKSVDELQSKETKIGVELASIKQDAIPAVQNTKGNNAHADMQTNANQKVLDLSNLHTSNTNEIIKKISDYVEQNNVANRQSLDLTVKHESLGEFKIQVSKMPESMNGGLNQLDMQITTSSKEGHDFFVKNEVSLMKNLNQAGINLSDLRIVSSMSESTPFGQSDSRQSSSFGQNPDGSKQFMSFESSNFSSGNGAGNGAERRKELWEEYQQRYGA